MLTSPRDSVRGGAAGALGSAAEGCAGQGLADGAPLIWLSYSSHYSRRSSRIALRFWISGLTASLKPATSKSASQRSGVING